MIELTKPKHYMSCNSCLKNAPHKLTIRFSYDTGLKDRNGVEIWEGDIVRGHRYSNSSGVKEIVGRVMFGFNGWDIAGVGEYVWDTTRLTSSCEVIGNIHDNLELLEVLEDD